MLRNKTGLGARLREMQGLAATAVMGRSAIGQCMSFPGRVEFSQVFPGEREEEEERELRSQQMRLGSGGRIPTRCG